MADKTSAVFIRAEGVLLPRGAMSLAAYFAANAASFSGRALRLSHLGFAAPVYGGLGQRDRGLPNRLA